MTNFTLIDVVDSDYANNVDDRKRRFGFLFNLESEAISWSLKSGKWWFYQLQRLHILQQLLQLVKQFDQGELLVLSDFSWYN